MLVNTSEPFVFGSEIFSCLPHFSYSLSNNRAAPFPRCQMLHRRLFTTTSARMAPPSLIKTWHKDTYTAIDHRFRPELRLEGKTAIISGGGSGIGRGLTKAFAGAGAAKVAILGRRDAVLQEAKTEVAESVSGTRIETCGVDIMDLAAVRGVATEIGAWDTLIANPDYLSEPNLSSTRILINGGGRLSLM